MSYSSSHLSSYLGALELQFAPNPLYTFVALSLIVLYQLKSLNLDDYNLIYIQNKNKGFLQNFDSIFFENSTFSLFTNTTQNQSKPIPTNNTKQPQHNPKTHLQPKQNFFLSTFGVFPNSNTRTKGFGFISYLKSLLIFNAKLSSCFFITLGFDFHGAIHKSLHSKTLPLSLFLKNGIAQMSSP